MRSVTDVSSAFQPDPVTVTAVPEAPELGERRTVGPPAWAGPWLGARKERVVPPCAGGIAIEQREMTRSNRSSAATYVEMTLVAAKPRHNVNDAFAHSD